MQHAFFCLGFFPRGLVLFYLVILDCLKTEMFYLYMKGYWEENIVGTHQCPLSAD